jgi:hypothetical protein
VKSQHILIGKVGEKPLHAEGADKYPFLNTPAASVLFNECLFFKRKVSYQSLIDWGKGTTQL